MYLEVLRTCITVATLSMLSATVFLNARDMDYNNIVQTLYAAMIDPSTPAENNGV